MVAFGNGLGPAGLLMVAGSVAMIALFAYVLGAAMSLRSQSMRAAFGGTFGLLGGVLLVLPLLLFLVAALPRAHWDPDEFPYVIVTVTNPATFLEPLAASYSYVEDRYRELSGFFALHVALYGGAIASLVAWMAKRFDAITGRSGAAEERGQEEGRGQEKER